MKRHFKDIKKIMQMKWRSFNFTKSVTRRIGRFYSLKHYPNQMNLKKAIDDPREEEQKPEKASSDVKKTTTKTGKKVKKTPQPKKVPKSLEFVDTDSDDTDDEQGPPQDDKKPPLLGMKEEVQSFFDLQKESKNLTIKKKVEKAVFMAGPYEGYELSYVALCDTKYLKRMLKMSGLEKKTKDLIKQALAKT